MTAVILPKNSIPAEKKLQHAAARLLCCVAFFLVTTASAQSVGSETDPFRTAVVAYVNTSPDLAETGASVRVARAGASREARALFPEIAANGGYASTIIDPTGVNVRFERLSGGLSASQMLVSAQHYSVIRGARCAARAAEKDHVDRRERLLVAFAGIWSELWAAREQYRLALFDEEISAKNQDGVTIRFSGGDLTRGDLLQARTRSLAAGTALARAEQLLRRAEFTYRELGIGEPPEVIALPVITLGDSSTEENIRSAALSALDERIGAASASLRSVLGSRLPSLSLSGSLDRIHDNGAYNRPSTFTDVSFGLTLQVPLVDFGRTLARAQEADARTAMLKAMRSSLVSSIVRSMRESAADVAGAASVVSSAMAQAAAADSAYMLMRREFESGSRTTLDILDAQRESSVAQSLLIEARREEFLASIRWLQARGSAAVIMGGR